MLPRRPSLVPAQAVELRSLWQEQACVVAGLRRFGCMVCRWIARDLSSLKGLLDLHGVRLVGVGPEALGLQEFLDGGYFAGGAYKPAPASSASPHPRAAPSAPRRSSHTQGLWDPSLPSPFSLQGRLAPVSVLLLLQLWTSSTPPCPDVLPCGRTVWHVPVVTLA